MAEYKLTYFDIEGLAEPLRLLFVVARVPFEDHRISYSPGQPAVIPPEIKEKSAYGQVPILEYHDLVLSQSAAIGRFLAKRFDLYGRNDLETAQIDEIVEALRDYGESFRVLRLARDDESKVVAMKNIVEVTTPKYARKFNDILENSSSGFLVGKSVSYGDLLVYHFVTQFNYQIPGLTMGYPALEALIQRVGEIPEIREWNLMRIKLEK